jgi:two-component system, sensor histidine kinase PdtaS
MMLASARRRFERLPTAAKLLLILTAVLLPIGLALIWLGNDGIRSANRALHAHYEDQARGAARAMESLIARNALALRIAANGALATPGGDPCARASRALTISPGVAQRFELHSAGGELMCASGNPRSEEDLPIIAPGDIHLRVASDRTALIVRVGVIGGMATGRISADEIRTAVSDLAQGIDDMFISDGERRIGIISQQQTSRSSAPLSVTTLRIGNGALLVQFSDQVPTITAGDRLLLLLPLLMWVAAALITWSLVSRLLIQPLRRLQRAVIRFQPGDSAETLPRKLGPSTEIQELRDSFARAIVRVEQSEHEMAGALEGQRRLVREVHHRVKNNLQVVASLLNIHGRNAETPEARAAYSSISRRVGALSIVHRNHFAEMEENRGIALRPLLTELAAELRASAPPEVRGVVVDLEVEPVNTTQDVAVAVAFLVTEIVEHAILRRPGDPIEVSLRRTSELTARLALASPVLVPDESGDGEKEQFERIVAGLAKQLRSTLERKLGRYSVDLPVFPPA